MTHNGGTLYLGCGVTPERASRAGWMPGRRAVPSDERVYLRKWRSRDRHVDTRALLLTPRGPTLGRVGQPCKWRFPCGWGGRPVVCDDNRWDGRRADRGRSARGCAQNLPAGVGRAASGATPAATAIAYCGRRCLARPARVRNADHDSRHNGSRLLLRRRPPRRALPYSGDLPLIL